MEDCFMNIMGGFKLHLAITILVLGFATVSGAWADSLFMTYTGTGYDTTVDNLNDDNPVSLSLADAKGSFGAVRSEITAEFFYSDVDCESGYDVGAELLFSASVTTFEKRDQLWGFSQQGWMCFNMSTGHYYGHVDGTYGGGTGRFEGASGEWSTDFDGQSLEPPTLNRIGFRTISGVTHGNVVFP